MSFELLHGFDTARKGKDLTAADLFTLDSTQKGTHVVAGFSLKECELNSLLRGNQGSYTIQLLVKHFCVELRIRKRDKFGYSPTDASKGGLERSTEAHDFNISSLVGNTTFNLK